MTIGIGTDGSGNPLNKIDLYPGGFAYHLVYGNDYCASNDDCPARDTGLFEANKSSSIVQHVKSDQGLAWTQDSMLTQRQSGNASIVLDSVFLNPNGQTRLIKNSSIDVIHTQEVTLPDGSSYSPQVGTLALGSPEGVRKYEFGTGNIIPNYLAGSNVTDSASTSLHYGSASVGPEGSLIFGGYDQSRVIGQVGRFSLAGKDARLDLNLVDMGLDVASGASPFRPEHKTGLIEFNGTNKQYRPTTINAVVPYFFMSRQTCDNIAANLPMDFDTSTGLYFWETQSTHYKRLLTSPAFLSLTFRAADGDTQANGISSANGNVTIKVPLAVLNLTLEAPLSTSTRAYFPCYPFTSLDNTDRFFLGRAFLQAAFVGMNFNTSDFFLAQAPGPKPDPPNVLSIAPEDQDLVSSSADAFERSWDGYWKPFSIAEANTYLALPTASDDEKPKRKLSAGTIAGIAIGITFAVLVAICAFLLYLRHRRAARALVVEKDTDELTPSSSTAAQTPSMTDTNHRTLISEVGSNHAAAPMAEMGTDGMVYEAQGSYASWTDKNQWVYEAPAMGPERVELGMGKELPELPRETMGSGIAGNESFVCIYG